MAGQQILLIQQVPYRPKQQFFYFLCSAQRQCALGQWCLQNLVLCKEFKNA